MKSNRWPIRLIAAAVALVALSWGLYAFTDLETRELDAATRAGLPASRSDQLVLAVHEVAASSLRDSGAGGSLRLWCEGRTLLCELSDASRMVVLVTLMSPCPSLAYGTTATR